MPAPVAKYFSFALTPGQPLIGHARIEHSGEFRTSPDAPWRPFRSVEYFSVAPPGFVWDARIRQAPLLSVRVRDGYLEGTGMMQARLANLIPVVDERGSAHLSAAALQRYLAEAPWLPTALLPGSGVRWDPIDPTRARATLTDRGHAVAVEFEFGSRGEIVRTFAPDRYRDVNGTGVPTPWVGRHMEYAEVYGMRIPMQSEVAWMLPDGPFAYWRGRIQQIEFDFAP